MKVNTIKETIKLAENVVKENMPTILTVAGSIGFVTTVILAVNETPKAIRLKEELEEKSEESTIFDRGKIMVECYWPAAATGVVSLGCFIMANKISLSKSVALAGAYSIAEKSRDEYKDKLFEIVGEKKKDDVKNDMDIHKVDANPPKEIVYTNKGDTLIYDSFSGRYFKGDIGAVERAVNRLNALMMEESYVTVNTFYEELGIPEITAGDVLGWNYNATGIVHLEKTSTITPDERDACLVISFREDPITSFRNYY